MTNETDLRECCAKIALTKRLLGPETFDLEKILTELEIKKSLLMKYKPRDYQTILKEICPETIEIEEIEKGLEDEKVRLEKEKKDAETRIKLEEKERKKAIAVEKAEKEAKAKAEKLKAAEIKAEKIAAKKAELAALEAEEVKEETIGE